MQPTPNKGFTLIEIMVAVSIFAIVATIAISALLAANAINQKAQAIKLAMDNLNYALDSITLKMKRGTDFSWSEGEGLLSFSSPKYDPDPTHERVNYQYQIIEDESGRGRLSVSRNDFVVSEFVPITSQELDILTFSVRLENHLAVIKVSGTAQVGHQQQNFGVETAAAERL